MGKAMTYCMVCGERIDLEDGAERRMCAGCGTLRSTKADFDMEYYFAELDAPVRAPALSATPPPLRRPLRRVPARSIGDRSLRGA